MDLVYDRHVAMRRVLTALFFSFSVFAGAAAALPILWQIETAYALWLAAVVAAVGATTLIVSERRIDWQRSWFAGGLIVLGLFLMVEYGRPFIPPAPLRIQSADFGTQMEMRDGPRITRKIGATPADPRGQVYVVTAVYAPRGLHDRVRHVWYHGAQRLTRSRWYDLDGGRKEGYRLWTSLSLSPDLAGKPLHVDVETESGQLIGRASLGAGAALVSPVMPRFRLLLEYNGTRYSGWQVQRNARTVQGDLIEAVQKVTGRRDRLEVYGAGRTDAGVHALGQVAHLDVATTLPPATLLARLNEALPADINVLDVRTVGHRFHARHDAVARRYVYQVSRRRTAFSKPFVWWVRERLDVEAMRRGAASFVGRLDFESFSDDDADEKSTKVQVDAVDVIEDGALVLIRVTGSHFLWRMVRRMVGVLVRVGTGDLREVDVARLLRSDGEDVARLTAPSAGLFLEQVIYPGESFRDDVRGPMRLL